MKNNQTKPVMNVVNVALVNCVTENEVLQRMMPRLSALICAVRGRKCQPRTRAGRMYRHWGFPPLPETWRHLIARYLRRQRHGEFCVTVGGHHIAIISEGVTLAQIVERKGAAL